MSEADVQARADELQAEYGSGNGSVTDLQPQVLARELAKSENFSDLAYSQQLAVAAEGALIHTPGGWRAWDGTVWADGAEEAMRASKALADERVLQALKLGDNSAIKRAVARCSESKIRACLKLAESDARLSVPHDRLDAHPHLLCVRNGVVDLRDGSLRPSSPELYLTKIAGAEYHAHAHSDRFGCFLSDACGGDAELIGWIQRGAGYSATGLCSEEVVLLFHGPGATGKTTLLEAIRACLGEHAAVADFASFLAGRSDGSSATPDIARLAGVRLACASEVSPRQRFNASRLKVLTGGERIVARRLYRDPVEFTPQFTLWLGANERPGIDAEDSAAWRRMRLVPFPHVIAPERRDPALKHALVADPAERAAVLRWVVAGAVEWYRSGLGSCAAVERATLAYRGENDTVARWLAACCELDDASRTPASELHASFASWCTQIGVEPWSTQRLASALNDHGLTSKRTKAGAVWLGVRVTEVTE